MKCDYHFIIKELAEELKGEFECLGENTEKYISFPVPTKKEHNNGETCKIKFVDTCRFMPSKLSNLVDNLSEINNKDDYETCIERKNIKSQCEFIGLKNNRLNYRCIECNGTSAKSTNELIENFPNTYQFCNGDLNKCLLLLRKGVYPYEYMDSWERFNETSLPPKKDFYSKLILEYISDADYGHAQKVFNEYCTNIGDYHDLYVQTDTLLLADVFEKCRDKCTEINGLDPSYFYSASGLAWQAYL